MNIVEKILRNVISNVIVMILSVIGAILLIVFGDIGSLIAYLVILLIAVILFLLLVKYRRMFKVLSSGARQYYFTFPTSQNSKVWKESSRSLYYLGVSADSIGLREFIDYINGLPQSSSQAFRFLLMDPASSALAQQRAHQKDKNPTDPEIAAEVEADRTRIQSSIALLKTSYAYKNGRLQIKLYNEFVPWWMYVVNEEKLFLGVLPKGDSGRDAPVLIMEHNRKYPSIFDPFFKMWERLWDEAKAA
jgi:hypothetical protein